MQRKRNHRKKVYFIRIPRTLLYFLFLVAPPPEPPRPSSVAATATVNERATSPSSAIVHLMSQFRMDKASEPMPITLKTLEKMSITETQRLLADNGLEK